VGLAHTILDDNPTGGALLDNLHVRYGVKRQGVGTRLLSLTAPSQKSLRLTAPGGRPAAMAT
jgi:hypothetical protein